MSPDDPRSRHVFAFLDVVAHIEPQFFVMENVKGLYANRRWAGVRELLHERCRALGYVPRMLLLKASDYGVPQARERMFFVGRRPGLPWRDPQPTTADNPPTVRAAIEALPTWGTPGNDSLCAAKITTAKKPVLRRSAYAGMLFNGQGRPLALDRPAITMTASMGGNKTPIVDQQQLDDPASAAWVERYHAHLWQGGAPGWPVPSHLRRITVQEAAALQTFPAGTPWQGRQSAQYRQIGNAVPPLLARAVADSVIESVAQGRSEASR